MASPLGGMSVMVFPSGSFARLGIVDDDDDDDHHHHHVDDEADDDHHHHHVDDDDDDHHHHHVDDDDEFRWSVMVFPSGSFARLGILGWVSRWSKMRIA